MKRLILALFIICCAIGISAQTAPEMKINVIGSHTSIAVGETTSLFAQFDIPADHHLTENFLEVRIDELDGFSTGFQQVTSGEFEKGEVVRRKKAVIKLPVDVSGELTPGKYTLNGVSSYQLCRDVEPETCFPPMDTKFTVELVVLAAGVAAVSNPAAVDIGGTFGSIAKEEKTESDEPEKEGIAAKLTNALNEGSVWAYLFVFIAGFLTSLTPCVYPMIPITISYIGGKSAGQGKLRGFSLSLFYVLGLALVYSALGVAAALTGSLFGSMTQIPAVLGGVALVFGIMGLSMLGLFDIQLPSGLQGKIQSGGPKGGYIGAISMGAVAGLVAAPCAGPAIIALMTFIATTRQVMYGFTLMMSFALGMGILFIALGTFSGLLTALPAAGMWMDKVKKVFGVVMLGVALYIAKPLMSPPIFGFLVGLGILMLGSALGAFKPLKEDSPVKHYLLKGLAILMVVWGIYCVVSLVPVPGRIVPDLVVSSSPESVEPDIWRKDLDEALKEAKSDEKMLILDFGAEWCVKCKELEEITFVDHAVIKRLKEFVPVKVDCTKSREPEVKKLQSEFGVTGLPTVIILDSEGFELARFASFLPPKQFLEFLDQTVQIDSE